LATIKNIAAIGIYGGCKIVIIFDPQLSNAQFCGILMNHNQILFGIDMRIWVLPE